MKAIVFDGKTKEFIDTYDKVNYKIWNQVTGAVVEARKEIRQHCLLSD
jgi:hypothetical protein